MTEFSYARELPNTAGEATLDHFLFNRREGHCEYFSTAMVVMLRAVGVHARNVSGFLGGRWNEFGQYLAVTQNEAHSWVEVWFPEYGWVEFDPTPSGSAGSDQSREWMWPGRFWFDGLQHRWNKWILDYSVTNQIDILDRFNGWMQDLGGDGEGGGGSSLPMWVWVLLGTPAIFAVFRFAPGRSPSRSRLSGGYLGLVRSARAARIVGPGPVAPLALVQAVRDRAPAAATDSALAVELYLRSRFGHEELTPDQGRELRSAIRRARRLMGRSGGGGDGMTTDD